MKYEYATIEHMPTAVNKGSWLLRVHEAKKVNGKCRSEIKDRWFDDLIRALNAAGAKGFKVSGVAAIREAHYRLVVLQREIKPEKPATMPLKAHIVKHPSIVPKMPRV